jgi:hypothetical protein
MALRQPLADLAAEYGSRFAQGWAPLPALPCSCGLLGWVGAPGHQPLPAADAAGER